MQKIFLTTGALAAALAVILGAFGAHALRQVLDEKSLAVFDTGVRYQFYHAIALLITGMLYKEFGAVYLRWAGRLFILGSLFFCGSLYVLSFVDLTGHPGLKWIGAVTPLGGFCFIAGWLLLAIAVSKKSSSAL